MIRAFQVSVTNWPEAASVVLADAPAKAKNLCWAAANEAGYALPFSRFKVRRASEFDTLTQLKPRHCYALDFVKSLL